MSGSTIAWILGGLATVALTANFFFGRDNCMIPDYAKAELKALHTTYVAENKEDYVNGDYRLAQDKSNFVNGTTRKIINSDPNNLPPHFKMLTLYYDQNGDGYPDLIAEYGKPHNKDESTVEFDENFDRHFDKRVTFRGKLARECFTETAESNPEISMYKAKRSFSNWFD